MFAFVADCVIKTFICSKISDCDKIHVYYAVTPQCSFNKNLEHELSYTIFMLKSQKTFLT